jgi:hypothetical protein
MDKIKPNKIAKELKKTQRTAFQRFPLLFTLLGTFGAVAFFYGFEGVIASTVLEDHPVILMATGILILLTTGTIYKKLG